MRELGRGRLALHLDVRIAPRVEEHEQIIRADAHDDEDRQGLQDPKVSPPRENDVEHDGGQKVPDDHRRAEHANHERAGRPRKVQEDKGERGENEEHVHTDLRHSVRLHHAV